MIKFKYKASSFELREEATDTYGYFHMFLTARRSPLAAGFTLLETLVAITLLSVAIVAPMSLTTQSLNSAYYARDQITASYLAQEAIEAVRSVRDGNILLNSLTGSSIDLLTGVPTTNGTPFTIDARNNAMATCPLSGSTYICPPLQTDGTLYGYSTGWTATQFTRSVSAAFVNGDINEIKVTVTISWTTGPLQNRSFSTSENLYRWVSDGSAS